MDRFKEEVMTQRARLGSRDWRYIDLDRYIDILSIISYPICFHSFIHLFINLRYIVEIPALGGAHQHGK